MLRCHAKRLHVFPLAIKAKMEFRQPNQNIEKEVTVAYLTYLCTTRMRLASCCNAYRDSLVLCSRRASRSNGGIYARTSMATGQYTTWIVFHPFRKLQCKGSTLTSGLPLLAMQNKDTVKSNDTAQHNFWGCRIAVVSRCKMCIIGWREQHSMQQHSRGRARSLEYGAAIVDKIIHITHERKHRH